MYNQFDQRFLKGLMIDLMGEVSPELFSAHYQLFHQRQDPRDLQTVVDYHFALSEHLTAGQYRNLLRVLRSRKGTDASIIQEELGWMRGFAPDQLIHPAQVYDFVSSLER